MSTDLIIKVKVALAEREKTQSWLAKQLGISSSYVNDILKGRRSPEEQIKRIKAALDIKG